MRILYKILHRTPIVGNILWKYMEMKWDGELDEILKGNSGKPSYFMGKWFNK